MSPITEAATLAQTLAESAGHFAPVQFNGTANDPTACLLRQSTAPDAPVFLNIPYVAQPREPAIVKS